MATATGARPRPAEFPISKARQLAKELAARIAPELDPGWKRELLHDPSTNALIARYRRLRDAGS